MSSIPISYSTAMTVKKSMEYQEKAEEQHNRHCAPNFLMNNPPAKYNGKMMNSIWGLYNRYAPPSFQKNSEADVIVHKPGTLPSWLNGQQPN